MGVEIVSFIFSVFVIWQLVKADSSSFSKLLDSYLSEYSKLQRPGCKNYRCGEVYMVYPFGMDKHCYMDPRFEVFCNKSTNPPTPTLKSINMEIFDTDTNSVLVRSPVKSTNCQGLRSQLRSWVDLRGTPFILSETNVFTVIGCNTRALTAGENPHLVGCESSCSGGEGDVDWTKTFSELIGREWDDSISHHLWWVENKCNGSNDCCQMYIPPFLQLFDPIFEDINNSCRLAFLSTETYVLSPNLEESIMNMNLELKWVMDSTREYHSNNTTCSEKSIGFLNKKQVQCQCNSGYEGNPYVGCRDIDECKVHSCSGMNKCVNTPGSYKCIADPKWVIILVLGCTGGVLTLLFGTWWVYKCAKKRNNIELQKKLFKRNGGLLLQKQLSAADGTLQTTKIFTSKELAKATDGFNEDRILGKGGQGTVFKGMLPDGRIVAVKISKLVDEKQLKEFINEVVILSQINHKNVVKLIGCCLETEVPLLVYEFVPNGSLYSYLHDESKDVQLTWDIRLKLASEVAGALAYLHSAASVPIYHRDIKSMNILLDEKYRAKVSDFGTSRSISTDQTHLTTRVQGTFGYLDPEYYRSSQFTEKSDVYSFGVVLVELLSGKKPIFSTSSGSQSGEVVSLVSHFSEIVSDGRLLDIVDGYIMQHFHEEKEIIAVANVAKRCLNSDGKKRPTMKEVVMELEGIRSSRSINQLNIVENKEESEEAPSEIIGMWDSDVSTYDFNN